MNPITFIFQAVFNIIEFIVKMILLPVDLLIENALPDLAQYFQNITDFLSLIFQYIGWAISASGIPYAAISLVVTFYIFKLTLPLNVWAMKMAIKWYRALKF